MKNKYNFKKIVITVGLTSLLACSSTSTPNTFLDDNGSSDTLDVCSDKKSLDCYVTVEDSNVKSIDVTDFQVDNDTCYNDCFANADGGNGTNTPICPDYSPISDAKTSCPKAFRSCETQCEHIGTDSTYGTLPIAEAVPIPENPIAVIVDITACFDLGGGSNEILFHGPRVSFQKETEGRRINLNTTTLDVEDVKLGFSPGRNNGSGCSTDLHNVAQVKFTPIDDSSITLGSKKISINALSGIDAITKKYAFPQISSFGIPVELRDHADLSQVVWVLKEIHKTVEDIGPHSVWAYRFFSNDLDFGQSLLMLDYNDKFQGKHATADTITMVLFMKKK